MSTSKLLASSRSVPRGRVGHGDRQRHDVGSLVGARVPKGQERQRDHPRSQVQGQVGANERQRGVREPRQQGRPRQGRQVRAWFGFSGQHGIDEVQGHQRQQHQPELYQDQSVKVNNFYGGHNDSHGCGCESHGPKGSDYGKGDSRGCGCDNSKGHKGSSSVDASQKGSNHNSTTQSSHSSAKTEQVNIYAPIYVYGHEYRGGSGGDVTQSNDATTKSTSSNENWTKQSLDQDQKVKGSGNGSTTANQSGKNSNSTDQSLLLQRQNRTDQRLRPHLRPLQRWERQREPVQAPLTCTPARPTATARANTRVRAKPPPPVRHTTDNQPK